MQTGTMTSTNSDLLGETMLRPSIDLNSLISMLRGQAPVPTLKGSAQYVDSPYGSLINKKADDYGIDPNILTSLIHKESRFNPNAMSGAGAQGLAQITPITAKHLGVQDPYNPEQSINGAAKYLSQLYSKNKDYGLALAAYNAGPGNVAKYGGIPPFPETRRYVKDILQMSGY